MPLNRKKYHMDLYLASFEPLMNETPFRVLDHHPDGSLVALQVITNHPQTSTTAEFSGIWEIRTGRIVWAPENTIAMAWCADGKEICMLRERYDYDPAAHQIIGGALQSEFTYSWERRTWPEKTLISSCPLIMPTGWPTDLAISPCHTLAAFQWSDQGESGLEFLTITEDGDFQLLDTGLPISKSVTPLCFRSDGNAYPISSNLVTAPTFSQDGRYIVFGWHDDWAWWANRGDGQYVTNETLAKVGKCRIGFLEIIDWEERHVRTIAVTVNLPSGWRPPSIEGANELLGDPEFLDTEYFRVPLPTGELRTYHVNADPEADPF
jgi:hypothetical protein